MWDIKELWPFAIGLVINIVSIALAFGKVRQDIAVLTNTIDEGVKTRLAELDDKDKDIEKKLDIHVEKVNGIDKTLFAHIQVHR